MNNDSQGPKTLTDEEKFGWDVFIQISMGGAEELRKELGLDEVNFRRLAPTLNGQAKLYFLYRIVDEIQKAGMKIVEWKEYLSTNQLDQLQRIDFETIIDDQHFRARKLVEVLVDAILFSTTNSENHYSDYFLLHELNDCARSQEDRDEFFGFHNLNTQYQANLCYNAIRELESAGLSPTSRWYLRSGDAITEKWTTRGVPFSSFRQRYKRILPFALPGEHAILGKSYIHAYGVSKDVHFTPHDTSSDFNEREIHQGVNRVGLLLLALIIRCQHLTGKVPGPVNKMYREMHDSNDEPAKLTAALKQQSADVGDIVWARGDFAEVVEVKTSKYGYFAYLVRYIERPPLSDVPEDWFAGFEVKSIAKKSTVQKAADRLAQEIQTKTGRNETESMVLHYAKLALIEVARGLRVTSAKNPK